MAGQEFQYIGDILKEWYAPAIVNQVYKKAPFWAQVKKTQKGIYGKQITVPVRLGVTEAVASRVDNNYNLPTARKNTYDQSITLIKRIYGRIKVDGFAIESAKGKGGWVDVMTAETQGVADAFAMEVDQQSMGRGTGEIGHVLSVATPAITVDDPHGITETTPSYLWFRKGMTLDCHDATDGTKHVDSNLIVSISGNVLTMTDAVSGAAVGDYLSREDSASVSGTGTFQNATGVIMGLDGIIGTDNPLSAVAKFQDIDATAAANADWRSTVRTTSGILTEMKIQEDLDAIEKVTAGEPVNLALTTYALRNKLLEIVKSDKLVQGMDFVAGWTGIRYRGGSIDLPILVHKFCPTGYIYYISLPHLKFYTLKKLVWDSKGGGVIKPVANEDAYEAWFKMYGNFATDCRNAHGKATGYTTS